MACLPVYAELYLGFRDFFGFGDDPGVSFRTRMLALDGNEGVAIGDIAVAGKSGTYLLFAQ